MKYKKGLIFICLIICLFSIASVCASDVNETTVTNGDQSEEIITVENNNVTDVGVAEENELNATVGTFTDLTNDIKNNGNNFIMSRDYIYNEEVDIDLVDGINITKRITIDGNGHSISGNSLARIFTISSSNVVLKNIVFINSNSNSISGGSICWEGNAGELFNCNFKNCAVSSNEQNLVACGGAVYWEGNNGKIHNCNFTNCFTKSDYSEGGAICWDGPMGQVYNCNFLNCYADSKYNSQGGAIHWYGMNGKVYSNDFKNCYVRCQNELSYGGAIYWIGEKGNLQSSNFVDCTSVRIAGAVHWEAHNGILVNCKFSRCSSYYKGGAICWSGYNSTISNSTFNNCKLTQSTQQSSQNSVGYGGAISLDGKNGLIDKCSFISCSISSSGNDGSGSYGGAINVEGYKSQIRECNFKSCSLYSSSTNRANSYGGAIYWNANNGILMKSNFENCYAESSSSTSSSASSYSYGGAVYWKQDNGNLNECNFYNCYVSSYCPSEYNVAKSEACGGAVNWAGKTGTLSKSNVENCYAYSNSKSSANSRGGALYWSYNGKLLNSNFTKCYVTSVTSNANLIYSYTVGGAVFWNGPESCIDCCLFKENYVKNGKNFRSGGGAIFVNADNLLIKNSLFVNNTSITNASAIYAVGKNLNIESCIFLNNSATADSGIYFSDGSGNVKNSILISNKNKPVIMENNVNIIANYNWWGNTRENFTIKPVLSSNVIVENWLCLDLKINKNSLSVGETSKLSFNLKNIVVDGRIKNYADLILPKFKVNVKTDYNINEFVISNGYGEFNYIAVNTTNGYLFVKYFNNEKLFNFNIGKGNTKIVLSFTKVAYNTKNELVVTLKDNYNHVIRNENLKILFKGVSKIFKTNNDGQVRISIKGLSPKTYNFRATFNGNDNYFKSTTSAKVTVTKATPKITAKAKTFKKSVKIKKYAVTLKDNTGKVMKKVKLTLKIKGKTFKATTNTKGKATFKITKFTKKGTFKAVVTYKGNAYYNKVTKKVKIKIK